MVLCDLIIQEAKVIKAFRWYGKFVFNNRSLKSTASKPIPDFFVYYGGLEHRKFDLLWCDLYRQLVGFKERYDSLAFKITITVFDRKLYDKLLDANLNKDKIYTLTDNFKIKYRQGTLD